MQNTLFDLPVKTIHNLNTIPLMKPYYESKDGKFKLYLADSFEFLKDFPKNSVDMVFADPPYMLSNGGFTVHAGKRVSVNKGSWDKSQGLYNDFNFHLNWIKSCRDALKHDGTIWISGTYHSIYQCGYSLQLAGYKMLNDIAWYKPNAAPNLSGRYFTASHETLLWSRKEEKAKHLFNYKMMKNGDWPEDFLKKPNKQMRSIWAINTPRPWEKKVGKHPTQKPFDLLKRVVLASTKKGNVILDPFTGSSTTGLAAYSYGRRFIGIDSDRVSLNLSIKRFEELEKNLKNKQ